MPPYRHLLFPALTGFASGLPFVLVGSTLQAWGTTKGLSLMALGCLTLIGQPYILKFLWAPLVDRFRMPFFKGHRCGWISSMMLVVIICLFFLSESSLPNHLLWFVGWALATAFFSATLDTSIDAYRTELLPQEEYGFGNASYVSAYRLSMLVGGGLALVFANFFDWHLTYQIIALLMFCCFLLFQFADEPKTSNPDRGKKINWRHILLDPLQDLLTRRGIWGIVLFIILYKFGENLGTALTSTFFLRELHFSLVVVGGAYKTIGVVATIAGAFVGGVLYKYFSLFKSLFCFGILQALGVLLFLALAVVGQNLPLMLTTVGIEAFTAGMATTVYLALLMRLCVSPFTATQFALLSACASLGRTVTGPLASFSVKHMGWENYFIMSFLVCIPALIVLWLIRKSIPEK